MFLQNLRESTGGVFDEFFNALSKFAVDILPFLPILSCVGFALLFAWKELLAPATIMPLLGGHWGNLIASFLMVLFAIAVWPLVIRKTCTAKSGAAQTA